MADSHTGRNGVRIDNNVGRYPFASKGHILKLKGN